MEYAEYLNSSSLLSLSTHLVSKPVWAGFDKTKRESSSLSTIISLSANIFPSGTTYSPSGVLTEAFAVDPAIAFITSGRLEEINVLTTNSFGGVFHNDTIRLA